MSTTAVMAATSSSRSQSEGEASPVGRTSVIPLPPQVAERRTAVERSPPTALMEQYRARSCRDG
ncbi:hypothetical protein ACR6C2_41180 [Streptomyces sp. INA 01156]